MKKPLAIMFVGKTHSGKTSVANFLSQKLNCLVLDNDSVALFIRENYPLIVEFERKNRKFYDKSAFEPFLKLEIQTVVYKFAIKAGIGVILSNAHSVKKIRDYQRKIAKELGIQIVTVNFQISDKTIKDRIKKSGKDTDVFTVSNGWEEVLEKQSVVFSFSDVSETDYLLDVDATRSVEEIANTILEYALSKKLI